MRKRIIALVLAFLMIVGMIPTTPVSAYDINDNAVSTVDTGTEQFLIGFLDKEQENITLYNDVGSANTFLVSDFPDYLILLDAGKMIDEKSFYTASFPEESFYIDYLSSNPYVQASYFSEIVSAKGLCATLVEDRQITLYKNLKVATDIKIANVSELAGKYVIEDVCYEESLYNWFVKLVPDAEWPADKADYVWISYYDLLSVFKSSTQTTEKCKICGEYDCKEEHVYCGICDEYDCGEDHSNDVPTISATVTDSEGNEQTVTVSGEALPEGASLEVTPVANERVIMEELGMDGGFIWDIKVYDKDGNEWQPPDGKAVSVTLPVFNMEDGTYVLLYHLLETPEAVSSAMANGTALDSSVGEFGSSFENAATPAVAAYRQVTGSTDDSFVVEKITPQVKNGTISFETGSFSVWLSGGAWQRYSETNSSNRMILYSKNSDSVAGKTFYAPIGQTILFNTGAFTSGAQKWRTKINGTVRDTAHFDWGWKHDNVLFTSRSATDATLVLNDTYVNVGDRVEVYFDGDTVTDSMVITIIVVNEVKVTLNENRSNYGNGSNTLTGSTPNAADSKERYHIWYGNTVVSYAKTPQLAQDKGYLHVGWNTKADGTGTSVGIGSNYAPTSATTLYAQWEPIKYTVKFNANGGGNTITGSMPTLNNMTYDVETTLPRNQFVNTVDGYVFLGWATSPNGDVVYMDGAKVKNLTTTNNGEVILYAKWKYGLNSRVYIGINNSYHNPNGTYSSGGVTINSYHTYPNEPAQMTASFSRVTNNNGNWAYCNNTTTLSGLASQYINGTIFNAPDYEMTYVEGQNTLGLADPTGVSVKNMLKFSDADYNAMINAWLNALRDTLIGYGDTTFDWKNAKAEDFTIVPYVIKFENYDTWYIDMVVVPKALYTLAYDGNIENGYTASFSGVAFPPSAQYTDGSKVTVVNTPIGYQNNGMKVTKVVDGHTYTASFQYWYDAKGNTYGGTTGNNTITLTEDTILYAKWDYPDAKYGNLNITKNVVDKDSYDNPAPEQAFSFKFITSGSSSYNYTIYDRTANVKANGSISNNGTFILQDGWRIRITDILKGETYSIVESAVQYYTTSGDVSGTISAGATTYTTITNTYQKYAKYVVKHHLQNASGTGYTEQTAHQQNLYGIIGENTEASAITFDGYSADTITQQTIKSDGTTLVNVYYNMNRFTVSGSIKNGTIIGVNFQTVAYGEKNTELTFTANEGYKIISVSVTVGGSAVVAGDFTEDSYIYPSQIITGDVNIVVTTAQKTHTITFDANYVGGIANPTSKEVAYNAAYGELATVSRTGYSFDGWYTSSNGGTRVSSGDTYSIAGNSTLYAHWTPYNYSVVFNGNGHTSGNMPNQNFVYDTAKALSKNQFKREYTVTYNVNGGNVTPTEANTTATATFNGWSTSGSGNKVYEDEQSVSNLTTTSNGVYNLFANWTLGSVTLPTPDREGYNFLGWYEDAGLTKSVGAAGGVYTPKGNVNLYAKWEAALLDLTISTKCSDSSQSFIFKVSATNTAVGTVNMQVILIGSDSITIKDLPVGTYTIAEQNRWSWRETSVETQTVPLTVKDEKVEFDFGNVDNKYWLSGLSYGRWKGGN